jgi:hypothetical protein
MIITDSPDLGVLEVKCTFDLTGTSPLITLVNQTTPNPNVSPTPPLTDLVWVLNIYSPTGTPIFQSDFDNPWITGLWTTEQITSAWPRPFGQIEWSGSPYRVEFQVKDSDGNIYDLNKSGTICRPVGNNKSSTNTFGVVALTVDVLCERASLYIKDNTSKTYQGIEGVLSSSYLAVDYPRDPTGVRPDPFIITSFVTDALVPFTYNGNGYEATYYSIYTYDLGDNVFLVIRYTAQVTFPVQCNIDLCPLACEVKALEDNIKSGNCTNIEEAKRKLSLITPMLLRAFIARANPTCGIDLPALVEEIKEIGGFSCDCVNGSSGIGSQSALIDGLLFTVNNEGGDVVASFSVTGNNVVLNIKDKSYTFGQCSDSQSSAILLVPTTSGTNTNVCLKVNVSGLAQDIYNATANNTTLLNLFNSLVINGGFTLQVDGKCVITTGACSYTWKMTDIPSVTNATLTFISVGGVFQVINYAFNTSTLTQLQTHLNTLGLGTFVVTDLGGGEVLISTDNNPLDLGNMVYSPDGNKRYAIYTRDCGGAQLLTPSQIVQAIIDYLCALDDSQVKTSQAYTICWIDPVTKAVQTQVVDAGTALTDFIVALLADGCNTITYIMTLKELNCANIQDIFLPSEQTMQEDDYLLGTKVGSCARIYPVELGLQILNYGIYNKQFMDALAVAIALNAGGKMCEPYTIFNVSGVLDSPSSEKMAIVVTFTHPSAISSLIRYARIDQGGDLNWSVPVNVLAGQSPYSLTNLDEGQYVVGITPVYADGRKCSEITKNTSVCGTINSFSAALSGGNIEVTYSATSPKVKVTVNYPNGGQFSQIYTTGAPISITPPADLVGVYYVTMQAVCNESTSWFGSPTAPSLVTVNPTSNSSVLNNSSYDLLAMITAYNIEGSQLVLNSGTIAALGGTVSFYIAEGFYTKIAMLLQASSVGFNVAATLVTGSGAYQWVAGEFSNVTIEGGAIITIIDGSPAT